MTDITVFRQDVKRLFHDLASESEGEVDSLGKQATLNDETDETHDKD